MQTAGIAEDKWSLAKFIIVESLPTMWSISGNVSLLGHFSPESFSGSNFRWGLESNLLILNSLSCGRNNSQTELQTELSLIE